MNILEFEVFGNSLGAWLIAAIFSTSIAMLLNLARTMLIRRRLAAQTSKDNTHMNDVFLDILSRTRLPFLLLISFIAGAQFLTLPQKPQKFIDLAFVTILFIQVAIWANRAISLWISRYMSMRDETDGASATSMSVIGFIARMVLWSVMGLMILDNLGVNITALVASLGIGGIAVALALQNILGDVLASLSIVMDKPFVIGDFIIVDDVLGTVEYVGLKTTRLRSLGGEQIILSNADLLKSRVRNYKRMYNRRVVFGFGITYEVPREKLGRIPDAVRGIIESIPKARFDRAHFKEYGESSLNFEVVFYVEDPDYNVYMDIQQAINLAIFDLFEKEGIDFAYPTRTLYLNQTTPAPAQTSP